MFGYLGLVHRMPAKFTGFLISFLCLAFAAVSSPAAAQSVNADGYQINIGDELEFDLLGDEDIPQLFTVGRDGAVQLPFIGGVEVVGMAVGDARQLIQQTYLDEEIFVSPSVELSVANFRPISVLGDVRNPGNFDYQPFMTAEQAVGLAGGPAISAQNEEARILERRDLEGRMTTLQYDLALAAAQYARVQAQLNAQGNASWNNVPADLRDAISRELFDEHKIKEDQVIALDLANINTQRKLLVDAVAEAEGRIDLLNQREVLLKRTLVTLQDNITRVRTLADRGLVPKSDVNDSELAVADAENDLLLLQDERSDARVQLADLSGQLSQFDADRNQLLLNESQQFWSDINKLIAERRSIQDRMRLLQQWMNAANGMQTDLLLQYQARRRSETGGIETVELKPFDELVPGDLLVVVVRQPESLEVPG